MSNELARKLISIDKKEFQVNLPSAVFGSVSNLAQALITQPQFRIGMWPCISESYPEVAMGLFTVLGYLLEQWRDTRIYYVFVHPEGDPADYNWTITHSQFSVDDWEVEGLDENIAIWGTLEKRENNWHLSIEIENDLADVDDTIILAYHEQDLSMLVSRLPAITREIAEKLNFTSLKDTALIYDEIQQPTQNPAMEQFLTLLFHWERKLFLTLWDWEWDDNSVEKDLDMLITVGQEIGQDFNIWGVSSAVSHAMLPGYAPIPEYVSIDVQYIVDSFPDSYIPAFLLGDALFEFNKDEAFDLLETETERHPKQVDSWLNLARIYRRLGNIPDAVDTLQQAIEEGAVSIQLYLQYAELLATLDYEGWAINEFVLIDSNRFDSDLVILEAIAAYQCILDIDPKHTGAIYRQLLQIAENQLDDTRFWVLFEQLVELDESGVFVKSVLDAFYNLEDISPGIRVLDQAVTKNATRYDLHLNLAFAYLMDENNEAARTELYQVLRLSDDLDVRAEVERLMLMVDNPDFEAHLGELEDEIGANKVISTEDVDFLEAAVEKAPSFVDGYILLAKAYTTWGEMDAVMETLLDGQRQLPDEPEILGMLAQVLASSGEYNLALNYLNKGLSKNPSHVTLLLLAGQYLFEDGQEDEARAFIVKAESIAPNHPMLSQVKRIISKKFSDLDE